MPVTKSFLGSNEEETSRSSSFLYIPVTQAIFLTYLYFHRHFFRAFFLRGDWKCMNKSTRKDSMMQQYRHVNVKVEKKEAMFTPASSSALLSASAVEKTEYEAVKAGPLSPKSGAVTFASPLTISCLNPKAEALAEAHRGRVEAEATAYLEAHIRKLQAKAHKLQAKAERQRMHEEGKALEARKREDVRAEQLLQIAEVKAEKILSKAREDAQRIKAHASEHTEKSIADAYTRAERWKAEIEETKRKEVAELTERVHMMIAIGELASAQNNRGVVTKMKQSWTCHP